MTSVVAPSLDELVDSKNPAWLWDTRRGRISWANDAGAEWFGAASGFDLAELVFDPCDKAIAGLQDVAAGLQRGHKATTTLRFPSASQKPPLACTCYVHNLADGRAGLLVCGDIDQNTPAAMPSAIQELALTSFPLPISVQSGSGTVLFRNAAMIEVFGDETEFGFTGDFLEEAYQNGTASGMRQYNASTGQRDIRVIVRRLEDAGRLADSIFMLVLEDVTERKSLERSLLAMAKGADRSAMADILEPQQAPTESSRQSPEKRPKDVAATLSHLKQTIERQSGKEPAPSNANDDQVPAIVSSTLNNLPQPLVLIDGDGKMLFANDVAVEIMEASSWQELAEKTTLADAIAALENEDGEISLFTAGDEPVSFDVMLTSFPWQGGPVLQATLSPGKDSEDADNRRNPGSKKKVKK